MSLRALFTRRMPESQTIEVVFEAAAYTIGVRRHARARRYTLRIVAPTREVMLTMPLRGSLREGRAFAERHGAWIAARLRRLPVAVPIADGASIPLRGVPHRIAHRPGARGTVWVENETSAVICVAGDRPHLPRRVVDYLKREAKRDLHQASRRYAVELGVTVRRVSVRDQVSRWGSCSSTGALSFSWRLILAPPHVLEYLAAHEVAHLVEMSHSRKFWRVLRKLYPDIDRAKTWLDVHGTDLHRYGVRP